MIKPIETSFNQQKQLSILKESAKESQLYAKYQDNYNKLDQETNGLEEEHNRLKLELKMLN